jgi:hypothetical protein
MQPIELLEQSPELFKVIKLTTGEMLMATLVHHDSKSVVFEHPLQVEFVRVPTQDGLLHRLSTITYNPFAEDRTFTVTTDQVQHINDLNKDMIKSYLNMVIGNTETVHESTLLPTSNTVH